MLLGVVLAIIFTTSILEKRDRLLRCILTKVYGIAGIINTIKGKRLLLTKKYNILKQIIKLK